MIRAAIAGLSLSLLTACSNHPHNQFNPHLGPLIDNGAIGYAVPDPVSHGAAVHRHKRDSFMIIIPTFTFAF